MLIKNPQMLWALWILVIPVLIHLLRFRRFKKTAFTNVRVLQQLMRQSQQGNRLKKWLILLTRMVFLTCLVLAFAQPYFTDNKGVNPRKIVVYLDNSFSMQAPVGGTTLMQKSVQDLIQEMPPDFKFAFLTNNERFPEKTLAAHKKTLLNLAFSPEKADFKSVVLRAESMLSKNENVTGELWILSDFIGMDINKDYFPQSAELHSVILKAEYWQNISIDSAYVLERGSEFLKLKVNLSVADTTRLAPVSVYNGDTLLAKSTPITSGENTAEIVFSLPADASISGIIRVTDQGLTYDNQLYFNLAPPPLLNVYAIGSENTSYLKRIYTPDEFNFSQNTLRNLDYDLLPSQDLIILNELPEIPESLANALLLFQKAGGTLMLLPSANSDLTSYNAFLRRLGGISLKEKISDTEPITEVLYDHPLFEDVFDKKTENFNYPQAYQYFNINCSSPGILNFQNGLPFLVEAKNVYVFASGFTGENSDFTKSPLIVPTLYQIGRNSLAFSNSYYHVGQPDQVDLKAILSGEQVIRLQSDSYSCIPQQQVLGDRVALQFSEEPKRDGNFDIIHNEQAIGKLSFNYSRTESTTRPKANTIPKGINEQESFTELLENYRNETSIDQLWKWFVIFALLLLFTELMLQKFWK